MNHLLLKGLKLSFIFGLLYSSLSIIFGLFISSSIILIDGVYTLIGTALTLLTFYTIKFIQKEDFDNFPFGKESLTPLIVFIQYAITLLVSIINMVSALNSINTNTDSHYIIGLSFAIFSTFGNLATFIILRNINKKINHHMLLQTEIDQWKFGYLFSLGVIASFILALLLQYSPWYTLANYIDPIVAIIITCFFIVTALQEIRKAFRELLSGTPKDIVKDQIENIVDNNLQQYTYQNRVLRLGKIGSQLVIEVDIIIIPNANLDSVVIQDQFRERVSTDLEALHGYNIWLNITFTANVKWTE